MIGDHLTLTSDKRRFRTGIHTGSIPSLLVKEIFSLTKLASICYAEH
jgi:hypothetical protein